jgi:Glucokinase
VNICANLQQGGQASNKHSWCEHATPDATEQRYPGLVPARFTPGPRRMSATSARSARVAHAPQRPAAAAVAGSGTFLCADACQQPFLAADVGGSHARLGLVSPHAERGAPKLLAYRVYRCADHPHLADIVRCFCTELDVRPRELVLACAGYVHAGVVVNKNLAWPVAPAQMAETLGFDRIRFLNDFEALAYATAHLDASNTVTLKTAPLMPEPQIGPVAIIGPGTGLGAAVWLPGDPPRVLATEAGQIQLAARVGLEQQLLEQLALPDSHTSYESVLSGPGLYRLYTALCAVSDRYPVLNEPAAITAAALAGNDMARETLTLFCGWLGSFAGDLVMLYGATGGAYLAGGFLSQIVDFMRCSPLVDRFLDKGVMRPFLNKVPIRVVDHGQLGVIGAASWYLNVRAEGAPNAGPASMPALQFHQQASESATREPSERDGSR